MKKGIKSNKIQNHGLMNNKNNKNYNDIYNINNFYSSTVKIKEKSISHIVQCPKKIKEKSISHIVQCPKYEELDDNFFEDNNIEVRIIVNKIINLLIFRIMKIYLTKHILNFTKYLNKKK